uniref:Uncharacterized protein n=1 Tax=Peronospora matthiolae TaxID=2874970 RepID=A0AAV1UCH2_9STRA
MIERWRLHVENWVQKKLERLPNRLHEPSCKKLESLEAATT